MYKEILSFKDHVIFIIYIHTHYFVGEYKTSYPAMQFGRGDISVIPLLGKIFRLFFVCMYACTY